MPERIRPSGVLVERIPHSGALILSALWQGYRVARTYYGFTRRAAVRAFVAEVNAPPTVRCATAKERPEPRP